MKSKKHTSGFTIIELMITIVLAVIVLAFGIPSFTSIIKRNAIISQSNTVLSSLLYARNETITENTNVVIQPLVSGSTWTEGWAIYLDGSSTPSRIFSGIKDASLIESFGVTSITYLPDGRINNVNPVELRLTPNDCPTGEMDIRVFTIGLSGQAIVSELACP
ncbi:MAG: GspH/FimT family pseudopilin [Gammaproteobacteria bacterium]